MSAKFQGRRGPGGANDHGAGPRPGSQHQGTEPLPTDLFKGPQRCVLAQLVWLHTSPLGRADAEKIGRRKDQKEVAQGAEGRVCGPLSSVPWLRGKYH